MMTRLFYGAFILLSLILAADIYVIDIETYSKSVILYLTSTWIFFLFFGVFGIVLQKQLKICEGKSGTDFSTGMGYWVSKQGYFGRLFLFPYKHLKFKSLFVMAFLGALIWTVCLLLFVSILVKKLT